MKLDEAKPSDIEPVIDRDSDVSAHETEKLLSEIWCEVLGVSRVDPSDNFFDLGGHSVLLAMVNERVSKRLGTNVGVVTMFAYPTVRSLAAHIDKSDGGT